MTALPLTADESRRLEVCSSELLEAAVQLLRLPMPDLHGLDPRDAMELGFVHARLLQIVAEVYDAPLGALPDAQRLVDRFLRRGQP